MNNNLYRRARHVGVISLLLGIISAATCGWSVCYDSTHPKVDTVGASSLFASPLVNGSYAVVKIRSDSVLGQRWAIISNCSHAEWPEFALPVNGKSSVNLPQKMSTLSIDSSKVASVVRAGDIVQLWREENLVRFEIPGISEESGELGKTIRVRLLHRNPDDQSTPEYLSGVVRGPANVEIQR